MPAICEYSCNKCFKTLHSGWGGYLYVIGDQGERILCAHPGERYKICEVIGISLDRYEAAYPVTKSHEHPPPPWWWPKAKKNEYLSRLKEAESQKQETLRLIENRTGFNSACLCRSCLNYCHLDLGSQEFAKQSWRWYYGADRDRDKRICPSCESTSVYSIIELVGESCPFCKDGRIVEEESNVRC